MSAGTAIVLAVPRRDYGPRQLADYLGAFPGQVDRARLLGLLPEPDRRGGRWSAAAAAGKVRDHWPQIAAAAECVGAVRLRERDWTEAMIRDLLGPPDLTTDNPHCKTAAPMRLWRLQKVEAIEASQEFTQLRQRAARRCAAAARGAETRRIWKALGGA